MGRLVVEAHGRRDCAGDPVDHDVREEVLFRKAALDVAVAVAPGAPLLDDPGGETGGADAAFAGRTGEAEARDRGHDDVECVRGLAAVGRRVSERADDLVHLKETAGPAMRYDKRES